MENRFSEGDKAVTFSKLALALANDYDSIYVVDSIDDSYVEYSATGEAKSLNVVSSGSDFYSDLIINSGRLVYPDDVEAFRSAFNKESVLKKLENGRSFSLSYRLVIDNKPVYYYLKTIRSMGGSIIIGVQNVDVQKRLELAAEEASRTYSEIAQSLASIFEVIYHIDIVTGHYTEYSSSESFAKLGLHREGDNFFERMVTVFIKNKK